MISYFLNLKSACSRLTKVATTAAQANAGIHGAQAQALLLLSQLGDCKISELATRLGLGKPAATTLVVRMEKAGLLRRGFDKNDARARILELTPKGRTALNGVNQMIVSLDQELTTGFSAQELEIVARFLRQASQLTHQ